MTVEPSSAGVEPARPGDVPSAGAPEPTSPGLTPGSTAGSAAPAPSDDRPTDTTGPTVEPPEPATATPEQKPLRSRTGATWVGLCLAAVVLVALIVFMLQNTTPVEVHFLGWTGTAPLAVALLIAGVGVGLVALVVGTVRITQLRRRLGAARKAADPGP